MKLVDSKYNHVKWADLNNDGVMVEIAVVKKDAQGNIFFIRIDQLDDIDKRRLLKIIQNRNAPNFELWDLMSNVVLGNGVNALEYFHQLTKVMTASGKVIRPMVGQMGTAGPVAEGPAPAATSSTGEGSGE